MKIKSDYVLREIADQYIVVPTGASSVDFNGIIRLNKSASRLFTLLKSEQSKEDLIAYLLDHYQVSREKAIEDVDAFIEKLESSHILENS